MRGEESSREQTRQLRYELKSGRLRMEGEYDKERGGVGEEREAEEEGSEAAMFLSLESGLRCSELVFLEENLVWPRLMVGL
jgi:hypothetical protein